MWILSNQYLNSAGAFSAIRMRLCIISCYLMRVYDTVMSSFSRWPGAGQPPYHSIFPHAFVYNGVNNFLQGREIHILAIPQGYNDARYTPAMVQILKTA